MTTISSSRAVGLLVAAAAALVVAAGTAEARPDPGPAAGPDVVAAALERPTGPAEHTSLHAAGATAALSSNAGSTAAGIGTDWLAAGLGVLAAAAAFGLAAGAVVTRRGRRLGRAV